MEKLLIQLFVLLCTVYVILAALAIALPNPNFPGKCYDGERTYDLGTYYPENECTKQICHKDYTMVFVSCGSIDPPEGYKNVPDLIKKYPLCCENLVRIEEEENIIE